MEKYLDDLFASVPAKAYDFAQRIQTAVPSIICDVGKSSNSAFLLRSFVSLRAENDGDELAVTIDISHPDNETISIDADICMDDGRIIAAGPSVQFPAKNVRTISIDAVSAWSSAFDNFLRASEPTVVQVISKMVESQKKLV